MSVEKVFAIVVNGEEKHKASSLENALAKADSIRKKHGTYNVWIRPHYLILK